MTKIDGTEIDFQTAEQSLVKNGWARVPKVFSKTLIDDVKGEYFEKKEIFERIQHANGVGEDSMNATHHTPLVCRKMLDLIDPNPLYDFLEYYFGSKFTLYTMGASTVPPDDGGGAVYTQNIHRDIRTNDGNSRLMLNTLVMLDDSTEENGATWMLSGSHKSEPKPDTDFFYENAERAVGNKGDLLLIDINIWHAAGVNRTSESRSIMTPIYCRPFMKQSLDYPRAFGMDFRHTISTELAQTLGYNALTPQSIEEFYQPKDRRFYKSDQG